MGGAKLNKRRKKMRSSIEEISEELLVKIISLLSFKDVVRTSIISRRWRHLWKHIPNLMIDSHNVLSLENDLMLMISMRQRLKAGEWRVDGVSMEITEEFICGANSILLDHQGVLDSLAIKFFLNREHAIHLDRWISCAIASRVKKLVLNLRSPHKVPITPNLQQRYVHLKHLELLYLHTINICEVIAFLDASPFLETFASRIWGAVFDNEGKKDTMQPKCPYNSIKLVTIHGFTGHNSQLELTSFLLAHATQLEVLTIQSSTRYSDFGRELKVCPLHIEVENKMFYELLRRQAPQHVKLLVL